MRNSSDFLCQSVSLPFVLVFHFSFVQKYLVAFMVVLICHYSHFHPPEKLSGVHTASSFKGLSSESPNSGANFLHKNPMRDQHINHRLFSLETQEKDAIESLMRHQFSGFDVFLSRREVIYEFCLHHSRPTCWFSDECQHGI